MPVAPPDRPGHVGYTPQHVGEAIDRARLRGVESSGVVAALIDPLVTVLRIFTGPTGNPQRYGHVSTEHSLAAADEFARREHYLAPWLAPASKWPGTYEVDRLPVPFTSDREAAAPAGE
jgi:hypothetical protein